jgi:hypothetical protein
VVPLRTPTTLRPTLALLPVSLPHRLWATGDHTEQRCDQVLFRVRAGSFGFEWFLGAEHRHVSARSTDLAPADTAFSTHDPATGVRAMANCNNCGEPFNATPWDYDGDHRVHVDCAATPPPKPRLGVGDPGVGRRPMASANELKPFEPRRPQRHQQRQGSRTPTSTNRTVGKCVACNRNVQSVDPHDTAWAGYRHRDCAEAARRMDQTPTKRRRKRR